MSDKKVEFEINGKQFEAYYVLSEDQKHNILTVRARKKPFPTKVEYQMAREKARDLLSG